MNNTQMAYAKKRADEIRQAKTLKLQQDNTVPAVSLTPEQRFDALKAGEFTIDRSKNAAYGWYNCITFNAERPLEMNKDAIAKGKVKINAAYTKLMDELLLGDNQEALKLLAAFEAA